MADARLHHYLFAHRQLPGTLFQEPVRTMQLLRDDGPRFLAHLWSRTARNVPRRDRLPSDGLVVTYHPATDRARPDIAVIELPAPTAPTEAWFVALCGSPTEDRQVTVACHTLERSEDLATGQATTVLGAWDGSTHVNRGRGPDPEADLFLAAITGGRGASPRRRPPASRASSSPGATGAKLLDGTPSPEPSTGTSSTRSTHPTRDGS